LPGSVGGPASVIMILPRGWPGRQGATLPGPLGGSTNVRMRDSCPGRCRGGEL